MQIPITRWPQTVRPRSLKINIFLHFLLCRRYAPLGRSFATESGNSFLQLLSPTLFCNLNLQFLLQILSATLLCDSFLWVCSSSLQLHFAAPVCNSFSSSSLQLLRGTPVCSSFLKHLLAGPWFNLAFVFPLLKLLLLLLSRKPGS